MLALSGGDQRKSVKEDGLLLYSLSANRIDIFSYLLQEKTIPVNQIYYYQRSLAAWSVIFDNAQALNLLLDDDVNTPIIINGRHALLFVIDERKKISDELLLMLIKSYMMVPNEKAQLLEPVTHLLHEVISNHLHLSHEPMGCYEWKYAMVQRPNVSIRGAILDIKSRLDILLASSDEAAWIAEVGAFKTLMEGHHAHHVISHQGCPASFFQPKALNLKHSPLLSWRVGALAIEEKPETLFLNNALPFTLMAVFTAWFVRKLMGPAEQRVPVRMDIN